MNEADWDKVFQDYQQIPQYQILHRGMTLDEFKGIFFWEWLHRLWGRMIGLVFGLPLLIFWLRKKITNKFALKLFAIFALGGLQGFIGWFMVQSGLETRTSVSPYRLALHLGFALFVYVLIFWTALDLMNLPRIKMPESIKRQGWIAFVFLVVTMVWGAFVAGLHAGEAYNTWPLMDGSLLPDAAFTILPKWLNIFENLALVQFIHRWLGPTTALVILVWVYRLTCRNNHQKTNNRMPFALGLVALAQVSLGLCTLLTHANIILATLHQAGAITLLTLLLMNLFRLKRAA